ncbi:MAG TPA: histidine kinase dimerization/phosphoacceptor domain -containing protein [Pseudolabrys sp.]|nr:histidine kinase dimerization/phosphoacceptor domain -containing protein [Pseudolabrys sp.]
MLTSTPSKDTPLIDIPEGIALALSHAIIDTVRDPLLVLDQDQRIVAASRSFYQTFKLAGHDLRGQVLFDIDSGQWNITELRELLDTIAKDRATIEGYEVDREFPAIGRRIMLLNVRKVFYEQDAHGTVLLAFEDITHRRAVEQQVQELMQEKDMLLEELQHRVANSLQIIASILLIKARTVQSEETRLQLEDAHKRVLSVAAVQKHLHATGHGRSIEIGTYLSKLCETLAQSMIGDSRPITLKVVADAGTVMSSQAVSIGLVVTELVMNALKHAFPGEKRDAAILVSYKVADTDWKLTISDNGIGKPDSEVSPKKGEGGLGTSLVQALTKQLGAQLDIVSDSHGTAVSITHATFKSKPLKADAKRPAGAASATVQ